MQLNFAPAREAGRHGDMNLDTTSDGGVMDMVTWTAGDEDPGHWVIISESLNTSESLMLQVTCGEGWPGIENLYLWQFFVKTNSTRHSQHPSHKYWKISKILGGSPNSVCLKKKTTVNFEIGFVHGLWYKIKITLEGWLKISYKEVCFQLLIVQNKETWIATTILLDRRDIVDNLIY